MSRSLEVVAGVEEILCNHNASFVTRFEQKDLQSCTVRWIHADGTKRTTFLARDFDSAAFIFLFYWPS
jgi:hypothetical protein